MPANPSSVVTVKHQQGITFVVIIGITTTMVTIVVTVPYSDQRDLVIAGESTVIGVGSIDTWHKSSC